MVILWYKTVDSFIFKSGHLAKKSGQNANLWYKMAKFVVQKFLKIFNFVVQNGILAKKSGQMAIFIFKSGQDLYHKMLY